MKYQEIPITHKHTETDAIVQTVQSEAKGTTAKHCDSHIRDTHRYQGHECIEGGPAARLEFVRKVLSQGQGADANTGPDAGDRDMCSDRKRTAWLILVVVLMVLA